MYKTLALALAAVASAMPAPQSSYGSGSTPDKSQEFGLAMKVDGSYVSLTAVTNGTVGNKVLKAGRLSVYPGTPAYFNGTAGDAAPDRALNFITTDANDGCDYYGIGVPDVGENYGYAASAFAICNYQEFEWKQYNGSVQHTLYGALNAFYACMDEAEGEQNYFLKFGVESFDGQPPAGCQRTEVITNCNVEGGATNCSAV